MYRRRGDGIHRKMMDTKEKRCELQNLVVETETLYVKTTDMILIHYYFLDQQ